MVKYFQGKHQRKEANQDCLGKFENHRSTLPSGKMAPVNGKTLGKPVKCLMTTLANYSSLLSLKKEFRNDLDVLYNFINDAKIAVRLCLPQSYPVMMIKICLL